MVFPKHYTDIDVQINNIKDHFSQSIHKKLYIIDNGPSSNDVSLPNDEVEKSVIFRTNWFFLEDKQRYGSRVDGFFGSVNNPELRRQLTAYQKNRQYRIRAFFHPFIASDKKNPVSVAESEYLLPNFDHWAVIATNPTLARFFMGRPLPSPGMQMLAFAAALGFKDICLIGVDFYDNAERRYAWEIPEELKFHLEQKEVTPGYEDSHSLDLDVNLLRAIRNEYTFTLTGMSTHKAMSAYIDSYINPLSIAVKQKTIEQKGNGSSLHYKNIYVTLADGRYAAGCIALARSLAQVSDIPLLVLYSDHDTPSRIAHLSNVIPKYVSPITNPNKNTKHQQRFAETYTKLRVFELLEFERIIFIDADCIVLKNIDELFYGTEFLAAPDWGIELTKYFNAGLFAFTPSEQYRDKIFSSIGLVESFDGGDQGFLNSILAEDIEFLPPEYNMLKRLPVHHPNLINYNDAKVIHFVGGKPWDIHERRSEYVVLEKLWLSFLEKEDWEAIHWMNNIFISQRFDMQDSLVRQKQGRSEQRQGSYGPIKKKLFQFGDMFLPKTIAKYMYNLLIKMGFFSFVKL